MLRCVTTILLMLVSQYRRFLFLASGPRMIAAFLACMAMVGMLVVTAPQAQAAKYAAIVIEETSGRVLFARNADKARYPASLTKIMTLYLLFEELESGRVSMSTRLPVSRVAASRSPSKLYLRPGQSISVKNAIFALITKSANDVATVVAEKLSGTEREFGKRMTRKARALGMTRTTFRNASGLPNRQQRSTARDMARLAIAIRRDFPQYFDLFSTTSFRWKGQRFNNHNKLLTKYSGTDGIKTGYINASGFNLVATVERAGVRLIGVVFGGRSGRTRDAHMVEILDKSFKRVKPADIRAQLTPVRAAAATALPKTLPVPPPVPGALPVAPPPRRVKHGSIDVALAGESAYLEGAPPTPDMTLATGPTQWSVQIGSFAKRANAHKAAAQARRATEGVLASTPARLTMVTRGSIPLWRVRFHNLDETQARSACAALFAKGRPCMAIAEGRRRSG
ncbi:MAG: serine hydrolase [Candidatus Puniceispirillaceae bacterium]|jgi:D-alanyl-D-alanine carboxypeptidase